MESSNIVFIIIGAVVLVAAAWFFFQQRRSFKLRSRFGPEYERVARETGSRRRAEALLERREKRVGKLALRPLSENDRGDFTERWRKVQAQFVDDPKAALENAAEFLDQVLKARGYPVTDFEEQAEDISVDHPYIVQNYRGAHAILVKDRRGEASTEELRRALVYYRELFEELLDVGEPMEAAHETTFQR
jgi:LPXTG-motif cell wall-anchored protein